MEKISGILPSSARVASVDMKETSPLRPGTPSFGRPEGTTSLRERSDFDTVQKSAGLHQQQMDWRSKDQKQAAVAGEVSNNFFMKNKTSVEPKEAPTEEEEMSMPSVHSLPAQIASRPAGFKTDETGGLRGASVKQASFARPVMGEEDEPMLQQPQGMFPKGSFINRTA